jgi:hypothetical protein
MNHILPNPFSTDKMVEPEMERGQEMRIGWYSRPDKYPYSSVLFDRLGHVLLVVLLADDCIRHNNFDLDNYRPIGPIPTIYLLELVWMLLS